MTTVVFRPGGEIQNLQVGAADIVALLGAAHSAWGWLGALTGVKSILDRARGYVGAARQSDFELSLPIPNGKYFIVTSRGPTSWEDGHRAFGGDPKMQFVGATLCALAHECGPDPAVKLFVECVAPTLWEHEFRSVPGLKECIQLQLMDNIRAVLNDGAIRGFTKLFIEAAADCGLTRGDPEWLKNYMQIEDDLNALPTELELVGGLLRWIVRRDPSSEGYFTRSGLVARVSVYLRSIGYALGSVKIWNGVDPKPCFAQGVILVTGGTESTDALKLDPGDIIDTHGCTFYYRHATVGAMLVNATLPFGTDIAPETAQEHFRSAEQVVTRVIQPRWRATAKKKKGIEVVLASHPQWRSKKSHVSAHATALASIYFPLSAHLFAQCYETIATDSIRRCVIQNKSNFGVFDGLPQDLITFRVVTAGIIIAIVATLGGPEYWEISHASSIALTSEDWLEYMAKLIDKGLSNSMPMAEAVSLLAAIHCAVHSHALFSEPLKVDDKIIGARVGIFSVVPSLFLNMTPGPESVGLVCVDKFIGNVPVHPDGWIKSGTTAGILWRETETFPTTSVEIARRGYPFDPSTGAPVIVPPDIPLYISIERPRHYAGPDVMLTGRVNGEVVGSVGIDDVLYVVLVGMEAAVKCPGTCPGVHNVRNIPASEWMKGPIRDPSYPICLQVDDDSTWRLLAAGQVAQVGGVLMYGCFHCALEGLLDDGGTGAGRKASVVVAGHERIGGWRDENRMV